MARKACPRAPCGAAAGRAPPRLLRLLRPSSCLHRVLPHSRSLLPSIQSARRTNRQRLGTGTRQNGRVLSLQPLVPPAIPPASERPGGGWGRVPAHCTQRFAQDTGGGICAASGAPAGLPGCSTHGTAVNRRFRGVGSLFCFHALDSIIRPTALPPAQVALAVAICIIVGVKLQDVSYDSGNFSFNYSCLLGELVGACCLAARKEIVQQAQPWHWLTRHLCATCLRHQLRQQQPVHGEFACTRGCCSPCCCHVSICSWWQCRAHIARAAPHHLLLPCCPASCSTRMLWRASVWQSPHLSP